MKNSLCAFLFLFVSGAGICSRPSNPPALPTALPASGSAVDPALERARLLQRPVLIYFQMQGCSWCRRFEADVLPLDDVQAKLAGFEIVKVDLIEEQTLARTHGIRGAPGFAIISPDGTGVNRWTGFLDRAKFLEFLVAGERVPEPSSPPAAGANRGRLTPPLIDKIRDRGFGDLSEDELAAFVVLRADEKMAPLFHDLLKEFPDMPVGNFLPLLRRPQLAVRLGTLQLLEDRAGEDFGFNPWAEDPRANAEAIRRWQAWVAEGAPPTALAADPEFLASRINDLLSDDDVRRSRGFRSLVQNQAGEALSRYESLNPNLSPEKRSRLRELRFALALDRMGIRDAEPLAHRLVFGNLDVRLQAISAVAKLGSPSLPILESFLTSREPLEREAAVDGLLAAGRHQAISLVATHLAAESDANVLHVALRKLGDIGGVAAERVVSPFLQNPDEDLTIAALESLARMDGQVPEAKIQVCLKDPRWRVRVAALKTASKRKLTGAAPDITALLADPDEFVRISAVEAISELKLPGVQDRLEELFLTQEALRPAIAKSMSRMDTTIPDAFLPALESSAPETVLAVIGSLPDADKKTEPLLRWASRHKNEDIACAALRLISAQGLGENQSYYDVLAEALRSQNPKKIQTVLASANVPHAQVVQLIPEAKTSRFGSGPLPRPNLAPTSSLGAFAATVRALEPADDNDRIDVEILRAQLADPSRLPQLLAHLPSFSTSQKLRLASALALHRHREARPIFENLLNDPDPSVRRETVDALFEDDPGDDCVDVLLDVLENPSSPLLLKEAMHHRLMSYYGNSADGYRDRTFEMLRKASDPARQAFALSLLGGFWGPHCAEIARQFIGSENPWVRRAAFFSLGKNAALNPETDYERIAGDSSPAVRAALPAALTTEGFSWKTYFSESEYDSNYENGSRRQPGNSWSEKNEAFVRRLAGDPDPEVRLYANLCLFTHLAPLDVPAFLSLLQQDPNRQSVSHTIRNVFRNHAPQMPDAYAPLVAIVLEGSYDEQAKAAARKRFPEGSSPEIVLPDPVLPASTAVSPVPDGPPPATAPRSAPVQLVYFSKPGCSHCARVKSMLARVAESFPELEVTELNINKNQSMELNEVLSRRLGVPENLRLVAPSVFTSAGYLVNDDIGEGRLGDLVLLSRGAAPILDGEGRSAAADAGAAIASRYAKISAGLILAAGILDGLNPCAFATIIFLLSYLQIARKSPREMAGIGAAYVVGVFSAYFLLGLGLSEVVARLVVFQKAAMVLNLGMGLLALYISVLSFRDGVRCLRGRLQDMSLQLPAFLKDRIRAVIRKRIPQRGFVFGAFGVGALISLLELACTGQVYAPTILYMMQSGEGRAAGYLALYNLAFILPLTAVFILALFGLTSGKLTALLQRHAAVVRFGMALLFLALALVLLAREWPLQ